MDSANDTMMTHSCRSLHPEGKRVSGRKRTFKTSSDWRKKAKWCLLVDLKLKGPRKMEDGKPHMTHSRRWKFLLILWKLSSKTRRLLSTIVISAEVVYFLSAYNYKLPKNQKLVLKDSINWWKSLRKAKRFSEELFH